MTYCNPSPIPSFLPVKKYSYYNSPHEVLNNCLEFFGISKMMLTNKSRKREVLIPRQMITYVLCKYTQLTLSKIAEIVGYKEHSMIIHSRNKIEKSLSINPYLSSQYNSLKQYLNL